jgi:hypothetical protein
MLKPFALPAALLALFARPSEEPAEAPAMALSTKPT